MKYRHVDEKEVGRQLARDAERQAFIMELAADDAPDDKDAKERADKARRRADTFREANKLPVEEVAVVRRSFLEDRVRQLENEHVNHTLLLSQKEGAGLVGKHPQDNQSIEDHRAALAVIEREHEKAVALLDAMEPAETEQRGLMAVAQEPPDEQDGEVDPKRDSGPRVSEKPLIQ